MSARLLADSLEVSVRTIYRDIDALSAAGVPVYAENGRQGGFALRDGYRTRLTGLDRPEAESLFLAGVPMAAEQLGLKPALARTRLKLLAALPAAAQLDAQRVAAKFLLDPVAWFQRPDALQLLPELAAAVWSGRMLQLRYSSWKSVVDRRVAPLGLVLKAGLWYLVAMAGKQARTYRVASIERLMVEDTPGDIPADFELQQYWSAASRDYEARLQTGSARVQARPAALKALARMSHAMAQAVSVAGPLNHTGWHELSIPIESVDIAVGDLLRLGPEVQALEPPELLAAISTSLAALQALYGGPKS